MTFESSHPEEQLSAFHDGELTETERAAVARRLESSPTDRDVLEEYRELSHLLQSLPRPSAPPQLQLAVMEQLNGSGPSPRPASRMHHWMLWGSSLVACAALLLLIPSPRPAVGPQEVVQSEAPSAKAKSAETAEPAIASEAGSRRNSSVAGDAAPDLEMDSAGADRGGSRAPGAPATALAPAARTNFGAANAPAPPSASVAPPPPRAVAPQPVPAAAPAMSAASPFADRTAKRLVIDPRSPPSVADLLAYVDQVADKTVIVELEVVDVDRTAEDMLVLLRRKGVRVVGDPAATDDLLAGEPTLIGVFVESTDAQLADVMDEVTSQVAITEGATRRAELAQTPLDGRLRRFRQDYTTDESIPAATAPRRQRSAEDPRRMAVRVLTAEAQEEKEQTPLNAGPAGADAVPAAPDSAEWGARMRLPQALYRQLDAEAADAPQAPAAMFSATKEARPPSPSPPQRAGPTDELAGRGGVTRTERRRVMFILQPAQP